MSYRHMAEPLHRILVDVIVEHIFHFRKEGFKAEDLELRMTYGFWERFNAWAAQDIPMVWYPENRTFLGVHIAVDDWAYDWKVIPRKPSPSGPLPGLSSP